ncbi:signal peptide peptidase SppA, partial [Proteus mirabilis]
MSKIMELIGTIFRFSWQAINFIRKLILNVIFFFLLFMDVGLYFIVHEKPKPTSYLCVLMGDLKGIFVDHNANPNPFRQMSRNLLVVWCKRLKKNYFFYVFFNP